MPSHTYATQVHVRTLPPTHSAAKMISSFMHGKLAPDKRSIARRVRQASPLVLTE